MLDYTLPAEKLAELRTAHRSTRHKREADRIKAVVLLATGWTAEQVAEVLLIDPNTVRNLFSRYRQGGLRVLKILKIPGSSIKRPLSRAQTLLSHQKSLSVRTM